MAIAFFCWFCSFGLLPVTRLHYDDREAFMDLSQASTSSDIHLSYLISAKSDDVPGPQLPAAGPASVAYLEQDGAGSVYLCFRGLRFGVEDYVPESLVGGRLQSQRVTAWEFVARQMLRDHGYREDQWPELARQFLIAHSTGQHDQSWHKR